MSKTFEIGDAEYEVHTDSFSPGSPGSYWEPPDGAEWSPENFVDVTIHPSQVDAVVPWSVFLLYYASHHGLTIDKAEDQITDAMIQDEYENMDDGCGDY